MRHIGLHHFAHLRAVAEGLDIAQCDARYLGTEHGYEARSAHQQIVDVVCSTALRRSKPWRLVGLSIKTAGNRTDGTHQHPDDDGDLWANAYRATCG